MKKWISSLIASCFIATSLHASIMDNQMLKQNWKNPAQSSAELVNKMSMDEKIGQMMMFDFRYFGKNTERSEIAVTQTNPYVDKIIHDYHLGSVILFRENLVTTAQSAHLINQLQANRSNLPLFMTVDQEGGYVTRLQQGTEMPGNMALGATRSENLTEITGMIHGYELSNLGFNWNFGPVVDINNNQDNPVINVRSYSDNPELVIDLAQSYIKGIHKYGLMTSLKHFPGHGNVASDTHFALPTIHISAREWYEIELKPFEALKSASDSIMTAHVVVPALDPNLIPSKNGEKIGTPATLSKIILTEILRNQVGFKGLIITDAMDMGAIATHFDKHWAIKQAILAGNDIILMPLAIKDPAELSQIEALYTYLKQEAEQDPMLKARIDDSAKRIVEMKLKKRITADPIDPKTIEEKIAAPLNKQIEDLVSEKAITLLKNDHHLLPYPLKAQNKIVIYSDEKPRNELIEKLLNRIADKNDLQITTASYVAKMMQDNLEQQKLEDQMTGQELVLLVTYNLTNHPKNAQKIIDAAKAKNIPLIVIASRNPYDIAYLNQVENNIAIYGITGFDVTNNVRNSLETNIYSGLKTLFAVDKTPINAPTGKLPVSIKTPNGKQILFPYGFGLTY